MAYTSSFTSPAHLEVLQTLVQSQACPEPVLCLTANGVLGLLAEPRAQQLAQMKHFTFDAHALSAIANRALGIVSDGQQETVLNYSVRY